MKKWFSAHWDEAVVYAFALVGTVWAIIYQLIQSKTAFTSLERVFWGGMAFIVSISATWAVENRGIIFAKKLGVEVHAVKSGRKGNVLVRCLMGFAFGFCIQLSLPFLLPAIGSVVSNFLTSALKASVGGAQ